MKDSNAMTVPELAFGVFILFIFVGGIVYVAALMSANDVAITDTYGNAQSSVSNDTHSAAAAITTDQPIIAPLLLIGGGVFLIAVLFAMWLVSKAGWI